MARLRHGAARSGLLAVFAMLALLAFSAAASAATFTPNTGVDGADVNVGDGTCAADTDGDEDADDCTLRAAIEEANASADADTIDLSARHYKLDRGAGDDTAFEGDLDIERFGGDLTITGDDARTTVINGQGHDRVFDIGTEPDVQQGELAAAGEPGFPEVVMNGVTVRNGFTGGEFIVVEFTEGENLAQAQQVLGFAGFDFDYSGGGMRISDVAKVTLNDTTVSNNRAGSKQPFTGGLGDILGILEQFGIGGGIANAGDLTLNRTTVHRNVTGLLGGGIANGGTLTINESTISQNIVSIAGGGVLNEGVLAVDKSTFNGNLAGIAGGGLANNTPYPPEEEEPPSSLFAGQNAVEAEEGVNVVENSTFTDNLARLLFGGGILTGGAQLDLVNDTIAANAMASTLLGQLVGPEAENDFLTFNGGRGAGLYATGPVTAKNTILASNIDDGRASNCWDFAGEGGYWVESLGNNILSDDVPDDYPGDEWCRGFSEESGDQIGVDPLLDDLHENGGPTETMALLPGSPALDSAADCPATDQRGGHRPPAPGSAGPECDIGAYEAYSLGDLSVAANVAGGDPSTVGDKLTYTLVVTNDGPDTARSVSLANALPAGVDFLAAPAGCTQIGQAVTCDLGTLDPDQVKIVKIDVRPTAAGTLVDTATISAPGYTDTDSANDSAAVTSGVLPRQSTPEVPDAPDEPDEQLPPLKMKVDAPKEITVDEFLDGFLVSADCVGEECQRNFRSHVKIKTGAARIAAFNLTVARVSVGSKYKGRVRLRPCVTGTSVASAQRPNRSCLRQLSRHARKFAPFKVKVVFAGYKKDGRVTYKKRFVKVKKG